MAERDHLIFYDQECGFCRRTLQIVYRRDTKRDRRLFPIALQDRAADRELPELTEESRMGSWHLKTPDGEIISGGAALAPLSELLCLPRALASFLRDRPELADRGYKWVADHRGPIGWLVRPLPEFERR
jgi:predicted DCC family thiol-disulfide oxidoreductase YuxK